MKMYPRHVLQDIKALLNQTDLAKITQQELRSLLCEMIETATETLEEMEAELDLQRREMERKECTSRPCPKGRMINVRG